MGIAEDRETGETYIFQIESSGQWLAEYGSAQGGNLYLALSGATEQEQSGSSGTDQISEKSTQTEYGR